MFIHKIRARGLPRHLFESPLVGINAWMFPLLLAQKVSYTEYGNVLNIVDTGDE
jgi:hypothetical protein